MPHKVHRSFDYIGAQPIGPQGHREELNKRSNKVVRWSFVFVTNTRAEDRERITRSSEVGEPEVPMQEVGPADREAADMAQYIDGKCARSEHV